MDLNAYLQRIALPGEIRPDLAGLRALTKAHAFAVPFENADVQRGLPIRLDLPSLEAKIVGQGRGGYCFEQNTLFQAVLSALGFTVIPLAARVRWLAQGLVLPRTHMLLKVHLPEGPFICDVGFGGVGLTGPLKLEAGLAQDLPLDRYRLLPEGLGWLLQVWLGDAWSDVYTFTEEAQHPADYEMANHYTSTHPQSRFILNLTAARPFDGGRHLLLNRTFSVRRGAQVESRELERDEVLQVLRDTFGITLPEGTRLRALDGEAG